MFVFYGMYLTALVMINDWIACILYNKHRLEILHIILKHKLC